MSMQSIIEHCARLTAKENQNQRDYHTSLLFMTLREAERVLAEAHERGVDCYLTRLNHGRFPELRFYDKIDFDYVVHHIETREHVTRRTLGASRPVVKPKGRKLPSPRKRSATTHKRRK